MVDKPQLIVKQGLARLRLKTMFSTGILLLLTACASPQLSQSTSNSADITDSTTDTNADLPSLKRDYPVRPFPTQTFYDLLVAEVAGTRGKLGLALENYRHQARITRDPGVIARAVSTASYQKNNGALQELGVLWAEVEPDNMQARNMALCPGPTGSFRPRLCPCRIFTHPK